MIHMDSDLYGAVHIWVVRENGEGSYDFLLQKHAWCGDFYPGSYSASAAGDVQTGEDCISAALRILKEGLGISAAETELEYIGLYKNCWESPPDCGSGGERGYRHVYVYRKSVDVSQLRFQEKVESVIWMELRTCMRSVKDRTLPDLHIYGTYEPELVKGYLDLMYIRKKIKDGEIR